MVRKVSCIIAAIVLFCAVRTSALAATHEIYESGNISTTYVSMFKDIISNIGFDDNYVMFRDGQYSHTLIVGDLLLENGVISLEKDGTAKEYIISTASNSYNSNYIYNVNEISSFELNVADEFIYSDLGDYPELIERGAKFETLNTLLICILIICIVINRIFNYRLRR